MAGAGGSSVQVVPAPRPGRVSTPDVFPNVLATTLSLSTGPALPPGNGVYGSAPTIKYQLRIDPHPPNLLELLLFATLPPYGVALYTSAPSLEGKYQTRIDPIPNLTLGVLPAPQGAPFLPQFPLMDPPIIKAITADQQFAIYQAPPNPAPTSGPPLRMPLPTLKYQVLQEAAPPNTLVRGIPQPPVPVAQNLDLNFGAPTKQKYQVYDLNLLWPNRTLPNTIPPPVSIINTIGKSYDSAFYYKGKGNVYDINYPSSQLPNTIPPGIQTPFLPHIDYYYMRKSPVGDTNQFIEYPANIPINTTVPNVVGMTQILAFQTLIASGFRGSIINTLSLTPPFGIVLAQSPVGGSFAPQNSVVTVTVAITGVIVPNVVGLTQTAAIAALTAVSLSAVTHTSFTSSSPVGTVISQAPVGGTIVQIFSSVTIVVAAVFGGAGPIYGTFGGNTIRGTFN